ncbi:MAG TPA: Bax inhibitor-1 family protein [Sandaracinaceae bacterium LLY-WYZ-13_1]|nr:Bax inhibitor-1 family protein [Sandaracinaceae bacterium LLY-WYZ-13_1]
MAFGAAATETNPYSAARASVDERAAFIMKTYLHLVGAVFAFVAIETGLVMSGVAAKIAPFMMGRASWFVVLLLFIGVNWVADRWARNATSKPMQYLGLALGVGAWSVMFMPLIVIATMFSPEAIPSAALVTVVLFAGLTGIVFITRKDFSFMRGILGVASLGALAIIGASLLFGFSLGVLFSGAMVVLAGGYILYNTSNVLHYYRTDQYVSAALTLFADVALLFWYVLQIFMSRR